MDRCWDFVEWLGYDMSIKVLLCLHDPADFVRAAAVSRAWRRLVIANGFCKNLVLRLYPEASAFARIIEVKSLSEPTEVLPSNSSEWEIVQKEHRVYAAFAQHLESPAPTRNCIVQSIAASSTDNFPDEHIENTLEPNNLLDTRPSYWSSKGAKDPRVPETLTYKLITELVIVDQINIRPFQAYFQYGHPIYSAQAVRFRMGHSLLSKAIKTDYFDNPVMSQKSAVDNYVWSYVSPTYTMLQKNVLQSFKLPRPVICIGSVLQIEFLGRVQTQEMDELYYICISAVQVVGRPFPSAFDVDYFDNSGRLALKYFPHGRNETLHGTSENDQIQSSGQYEGDTRLSVTWHAIAESVRQWRGLNEMIISTLLGAGNAEDDSDEEESVA